jgi:hypothetical protein
MTLYKKLAAFSFFLLTSLSVFAQDCSDGPGLPGDDPDAHPVGGNGCPLDTWVIVLVAVALLFTVWHLHRKQNVQNCAN